MILRVILFKSTFLFISFFIATFLAAQCPIETSCGSLAVQGGFPTGGNTFFCEGELVTFENNTDPTQVDTTIIDWGDGHIEVYTNDLNYQHIYDFGVDTCLIGATSIAPQITMTVINVCAEGQSVNCVSTYVQIKVKPFASFNADTNGCVGEPISFLNESCVNGEDYSFLWDFGGQGTSTEENPTFVFNSAGVVTVTLVVANECGEDTYTQNINILDQPIANVTFAETGMPSNTDTTACSPFNVTFDNSLSDNGSSYHWEITLNGSEVLDSLAFSNTDLEYTFNSPGTYIVTMTTNSVCDNVSWSQLFTIEEGPAVNLIPQDPTCETFFYTPNVIYSGGDIDTYQWTFDGGNPMTSTEPTPTDIEFSAIGPHPVSLTVTSTCGTQMALDTFFILDQQTAQISFGDTTICSLDGDIVFTATPDGGEWRIDGVLFDGTIDPEDFDGGTYEISYGLEPCITTDRINLTILKADIDMPDDTEVCLDDSPVTFMAAPPGGIWSGTGVTPAGVFDPAITGVGTFTLHYEIDNTEFPTCSNIDSFQVTVSELHVDFEVTSCEGNTLCFDTLNTSNFTGISWDFDGLGTSSQLTPCFTFPNAQSYDVTVTIMNGNCDASITKTVAIEPPPVADFNLNYNIDGCSPLSVEIINNSSPAGSLIYEWLLNGEVFSTEENPNAQLLEAITQDTIFEIQLTVSNDCSSDTQTESILVHPRPVSIFGTDQNQYCSGDTVRLANISYGNVDTYEWFLNGNSISTDSIEPIISYLTDMTDTIEVCLITTNDCGIDTLCRDIEIIPTDVNAFFNTSPTSVCAGDTVWFTNFATNGVPVFYDFGDGNSTSNPNPFHIYQDTGTYIVIQRAFGCGSDQFEKVIEVHDPPIASWVSPAFGCPGSMLFFENTSANVMRFEWDFGDGSPISEEESPNHAFFSSGVYQVCLTVFSSEADGCANTLCQNVEIFEPPVAGFTQPDSICFGDTIQINNTAIGGSVLMCDFQFGDDNQSDLCTPSHVYSNPGVYVVTQIVTDQNLCSDTTSHQVFVRELPMPNFDFQLMNGCHPDSVTFFNLSQNADAYEWDFGDGTTSLLTNPVHYYANPGTYSVSLIASIDGVCFDQMTRELIINETPQALFEPDVPSSCAGLEVSFANNSTGAYSGLEWDFGDGVFSFDDSPQHSFEEEGIYDVRLIIDKDGNCPDTLVQQIEIFEAIEITSSTTDLVCYGEPTGSIDVNLLSGTPPYQFNWSNGIVTEDPSSLAAGDYLLTITDAHNCEYIIDYTITQPTPIVAELEDESIVSCYGGSDGSIAITASGGTPDYQYNWDTGSSTNSISNMPAGDYTITVTDANGCAVPFVFTVHQNDKIMVTDSVMDISCFGYGDGEIIINSIMGGVPIYNLTLEGPVNYESINRRFGELLPGEYLLTIEDAEGCQAYFDYSVGEPDSTFIRITQDELISFSNDTAFIKLGQYIRLTTDYNALDPVFEWHPPLWLDCDDCYNPTTAPFDDISYEVVMTNTNGCVARDSIFIQVDYDKEVFFPTAFTPNGDGFNDVFRIRSNAEAIIAIKELTISDRWGAVVFRAKDFKLNDKVGEWGGTLPDGKKLSPAVYIYKAVIQFIDGETEYHGDVTLIR